MTETIITIHLRSTNKAVYVNPDEARELLAALLELFTPVSAPSIFGSSSACAVHQESKGNKWNGTEWVPDTTH